MLRRPAAVLEQLRHLVTKIRRHVVLVRVGVMAGMFCRLGHGPHYSEAKTIEKTGNNAKTNT